RRLDELLVQMAVGAFEGAHEGPLLGPAVPALVLLLLFPLAWQVVADARRLFVEPRHSKRSVRFQAIAFVISPRSCESNHSPHHPARAKGGTALMRVSIYRGALRAVLSLAGSAAAQSPADFYKGKNVDLYIGYSVGGGYDVYARLLARHMGK